MTSRSPLRRSRRPSAPPSASGRGDLDRACRSPSRPGLAGRTQPSLPFDDRVEAGLELPTLGRDLFQLPRVVERALDEEVALVLDEIGELPDALPVEVRRREAGLDVAQQRREPGPPAREVGEF